MRFAINHNNINVLDLEKSLKFYKEALNMVEHRRKISDKYIIVFLKDQINSKHALELTWIKDKNAPYELGDNEIHIAFKTDDFQSSKKLHESMGVICFDRPDIGIYFIEDPDGYWIEILAKKPEDIDI